VTPDFMSLPSRYRVSLGIALCLTPMVAAALAAAEEPAGGRVFRVLVLDPEIPTRPAFHVFMKGLRRTLDLEFAGTLHVFTENLDLSRLGKRNEADDGESYAWLLEKYRDARFDAIVAVEELPLQLALRHRDRIAPGAPVLFTSIEQRLAKPYLSEQNVTGVFLELPALQTIEMATRLFPRTKAVAYVGNAPGRNPHFTQQAGPVVRDFAAASRLEFIPLFDLPLDALGARLRSLAPDTLVFYEALWKDPTGAFLVPAEALEVVARDAAVPIFGVSDTYLGRGIIGGWCVAPEQLGEETAALLTKALREPALPPPTVHAGRPMFDARQLSRFRVDPARLTPGSEVRFREPTLWSTHRSLILGTAAAVLLQAALIGALAVQLLRRRRAEAMLRESEADLYRVLDNLPFAVGTTEAVPGGSLAAPGRRITFINRRFTDTFGYSLDDVTTMGEWVKRAYPDEAYRSDVVSWWDRQFERIVGDGSTATHESRIATLAGDVRDVVISAVAVKTKLIAAFHDVTANNRSERLLREQREQIAHAGRVSVLGQLAAALAHELNQPLGAIQRNSEAAEILLESGQSGRDELLAIIADIHRDNLRAGAVLDRIRGLLTRRPVHLEPVEVEPLINEVVALARPMMSHALSVACESGLPPIRGDRVLLQQIVLNLLVNAIEALGERRDGRVSVRAERADGGSVRISVADNGGGIVRELEPRVLEPFFTTKPDGLGMGLPIIASGVEELGGSVRIDNEPGIGFTVHVTVPGWTGGEAA
jgi:signal transduction histidine kinase